MFPNQMEELYIGDLESFVTEQMLYSSFSRFGLIQSVKIMRHIITHESRGFAFLTFRHRVSADKAISEMDGSSIINSKIKVCRKVKYNSVDRNAELLLLNLPKSFTRKCLEKMLVNYSNVFSLRLSDVKPRDKSVFHSEKMTAKCANLLFENMALATKFRKEFDGSDLKGSQLKIVYAQESGTLSIKWPSSENAEKTLTDSLQNAYGEVTLVNAKASRDKKEYMAKLVFTDTNMAKEFYINWKTTSHSFPVHNCYFIHKRSRVSRQTQESKRLFCKINLQQAGETVLEEAVINELVKKIHPGLLSGTLSESLQYETVFSANEGLVKYVLDIQKKKSCLTAFIDYSNMGIEYPESLIVTLKSLRWNKMTEQMEAYQQQMYGQMMPMPGYNMPQRMNYNPAYRQQNGFQGHPMNNHYSLKKDNMMNMHQMQMGYRNNMNPMFNMDPMNSKFAGMSGMPEISGLEVILSDPSRFKNKTKVEQNQIFMNILRSKMEKLGDERVHDQKFMSKVAEFFLDDQVVDLDERMNMLDNNKLIIDFLKEIEKEQEDEEK